MQPMSLRQTLLVVPILALVGTASGSETPHYFNLTAIGASKGRSTIECWQLTQPLTVSTDAGTAGVAVQALGEVQNASYGVIPAGFDGGMHVAPAAQYVSFLSGLAVVTLPDSNEKAVIHGGANGLVIAADTASVSRRGHITKYPGKTTTATLQIPFRDGTVPAHKVLHRGQCTRQEQTLAG